MPIDYRKYPENWKTEIRPAILRRAHNCCEFCGVENYSLVWRTKLRNMDDLGIMQVEYQVKVVLTVSHLNHDITDNRPENLKALCQKCHLAHDAEHHRQSRYNNKLRGCPDLVRGE